jgi:hypothetical protein
MSEFKDDFIKSMDYCQKAIDRMAGNSFKLKSWFLAAFTALFTFFAKSESKVIADLIWLTPLLTFVYLDAFYLKLERNFVGVFSQFAKQVNNYSAEGRQPFDLRPLELKDEFTVLNVVFSTSVGWFYFPLLTAFQGMIIFHTLESKCYPTIIIFPFLMLLLAAFFCKKTEHQK